jgi:pSer/pThr/pTyr-binding forkhead associated (FHA) protein
MLSTPRVVLEEDADLSVGEFGIATRMVRPRRAVPTPAAPADGNAPQPPPPPGNVPTAVPEQTAVMAPEEAERLGLARAPATLTVGEEKYELVTRTVTIGRSRECDISIPDPNVSRRHAEIKQEEGGYFIVDLGSTNGTALNGKRVTRARLEPKDRIVLGETEVVFERDY